MSYFDPLADVVSRDILEQVGRAELDAIHRGAGRLDESVLLHGVRTLVSLVRTEADEQAAAKAEERHSRLREHYRSLEQQLREQYEDSKTSLVREHDQALKAYKHVFDMLLHYRRKGTKRVPLQQLAMAMGVSLTDWHVEPDPRPFDSDPAVPATGS
jgi:hypothetical protein